MVPRNVIILGAATTDRRFVLELSGALDDKDPSPSRIFETRKHSVTISKQQYILYDTAGLPDSDGLSLGAREVFGNLYRFICMLDGGINLLIYIVHDQPSPNNLKLFHDYLCRQNCPIILVTTNPSYPPSIPDGFTHLLVLPLDGTMPEKDKTKLQKAITDKAKKNAKMMQPMDRFELTARESWKILEQVARCSLTDCRGALKATFMEDAFLSEEDANARCRDIAEYIKKHYFRNVIVFGDTDAGKTSVIKMLTDKCEIDTTKASRTGSSTFKSQVYNVDIEEYHYLVHDTVGFNDATLTSLPPEEVKKALHQLILELDGGISMLVYVHRGKIKPSQVNNYKIFSHDICQKMVPTVLVVTGLEQEDSRKAWWDANKYLFDAQKIDTKYHACITSTKGKFNQRHQEFIYQDEYDESRKILKDVFLRAHLLNPWQGKTKSNLWTLLLVEISKFLATTLRWGPLVANQSSYKNLMAITPDARI